MRRSALAALAACVSLASPALAATCPTGPTGRWVVKDWESPPITSASQEDVDRVMGKTVLISDKLVVFPGVRCEVSKVTKMPKTPLEPQDQNTPEKWPEIDQPYQYACANGVEVPVFLTGPSCNAIVAVGEAIAFRLVRVKPRRSHGPR